MPSRTVWLLSLGLHGAILGLLPATHDPPPPVALDSLDVTFDVVRVGAAPATSDPVREQSQSSPRVAAKSTPNPSTTRRSPTARLIPPNTITLDPKIVAGAFLRTTEAESSNVVVPDDAPNENASAGAPSYFEGVGTKRYLTKRDPPALKRNRDGSYDYRGHAFRATIQSDGSVAFDDRYQQGLPVVFDLTDAVLRRRGEDPYRAEKQWFLDGTADLRGELLEQWRRENLQRALRKLVARLRRISEDETISQRQKADRILTLYRDTNDGEAGAAARDAISAFVAEEHPELSLPER